MKSRALIIGVAFVCLAGCASARMSDHEGNFLFRSGRYDQAADELKQGLQKQGDDGHDLLLYLLDVGLSLHAAGRYEESNKYFLRADKIAEIKDYTSLTKEGETLLVSENAKDYKGEDFEKVLVNTYLAMNYALMGNWEDSLVEARRVNQKLYMMDAQGARKYKQNAFARYLSATVYEAQGDYDDAYVDYKNTHDLDPEFPSLGRDLWRCAKLLAMDDEMERWDQAYHLSAEDHRQAMLAGPRSGKGEIIVIYENGISPIKRPNPQWPQLPAFFPRFNPVRYAQVDIVQSGGQGRRYQAATSVLHDIEWTAIENLQEKYGGMIAKKLAGMVAKGAVGYGVAQATHSEFLGALTGMLLNDLDRADLRSWFLLPRDLQIARVAVDPGTYDVGVLPVGAYPLAPRTVQVGVGKKVFVDYRYMP